jgi:hypothetical protein
VAARLVAVAALVALAAAGCGGNARRDAVSTYLDEVNVIQTKFAAPLLIVSRANRDFATHANSATVSPRLLGAANRIDALRRQLAALDAPPEAARLKSMLVELAVREAALAREVARLSTFLPVYQATLKPLAPAGARLKAALAKKKTSASVKADALDAYSATIAGVLSRLRTLHPAPVSAADFENQVSTLEQVRASASALATAVRAKQNKDLPSLLHRFNAATVSNQSAAAQRAQINAVRAYDGRIVAIDELDVRISREHARLERAVG